MKKEIAFLGGVAAGFLLVFLAAEFFFTEDSPKQDEGDDERRIAEWGVGS